ncbi:RNA polymerase sigma factor [Streptomyces sp. NPDC096013]|uniref:RNA polymerase sigma factor n=1 Tax=Streptomyces sp. NPDC096013 TaxID=3366069 RepID=UPI0037F21F93
MAPPLTAGAAFDALYIYAAPSLVQQAYLLTGCRRLAFESTEHAFRRAWEHWPEVARDPDPVAWVREHAHEYALSPWHRFRPAVTQPVPGFIDPLLRALSQIPPFARRAVLLCDGVGLSVSEAAAETQASTAATQNRLFNARTILDGCLPEGDPTARDRLKQRLEPAQTATLARPASVRDDSERRVRALTLLVAAVTAALVGLIVFTVATSAGHYEVPARHGAAASGPSPVDTFRRASHPEQRGMPHVTRRPLAAGRPYDQTACCLVELVDRATPSTALSPTLPSASGESPSGPAH